jgi:DNA-binding transcriptional regulator YiaG
MVFERDLVVNRVPRWQETGAPVVTPRNAVVIYKHHAYSDHVDNKTLKRRRLALGYSQARLAALLRVHVLTVSKWERGLHPIPESVALLLQHLKPKEGGRRSK